MARNGEAPLRQIAKDFGISEACLHRRLQIADREDGADRPDSPAAAANDAVAQLREAHKRIKLLVELAVDLPPVRFGVTRSSVHVTPGVGLVGRPVVGQDPFDGDPVIGEPRHITLQHANCGSRILVGVLNRNGTTVRFWDPPRR